MIEREHIGIFGKMNAGKSSLMNLITQQTTSIVDPTPGTTADTQTTPTEIHGLGPAKPFDTPGLDEGRELGEKKRQKAYRDLKECDLVLLLIDPATRDFAAEAALLSQARELDKQILIVFNLFTPDDAARITEVKEQIPLLRFCRSITLEAIDDTWRLPLIDFILEHYEPKNRPVALLPFLKRDEFYILNIPMDAETPPGRFLRPQAMCEEYITRHWAYPVAYRMDLRLARAGDPGERQRFSAFLNAFHRRPRAIITDSQAMDIMHVWTPDDIGLTTFSIMMINYTSRGRLPEFAEGLRALETIRAGDRILIAEACNHSRIQEDIGTVQIPRAIAERYPGVIVEHNFGREFQENEALSAYKLVIHCGGCMISPQKLTARIRDLSAIGVPYTNYGVFLAALQGKAALARVLRPWTTP